MQDPDATPHGSEEAPDSGLYTMSAGGYDVACDAYCRDPSDETLWFVSLVGSQTALKAVTAALLNMPPKQVHLARGLVDEGLVGGFEPCVIPRETLGSWTMKQARLASGRGWHSFAYTKWAEMGHEEQRFLLLAREEAEAPALHYRFLNRRSRLPLHQDWAQWLWERGLEKGEVKPLDSLGVLGYRCVPDEERLREEISAAVARGLLTVPAQG